jgi:hypothetical protein
MLRCLVISFVLCAVAVCALTPPQQLNQESTIDAQALISYALDGFELDSWPYAEPAEDTNATDSKACWHCLRKGVKYVLKHAEKHVRKVCKHTKCPVIKRRCEFIHQHPKIGRGMIIAYVRPLCLAHAYCTGKGDCKHKKSDLDIEAVNDEHVQSAQLISWILNDESFLDAISPNHLQNVSFEESVDRSLDAVHMDSTSASPSYQSGQCRFCIHFTAHLVMHHTLSHVKKYCEHATGHGKQWCKWAEKHREEAFGMLLVKVRPEEWGCGFCVGKGICGGDHSQPEPLKLRSNLYV